MTVPRSLNLVLIYGDIPFNMGDMAESISPILLVVVLLLQFESSISKTVRGTGLKFCTQVGSDDLTYSDLSKCL